MRALLLVTEVVIGDELRSVQQVDCRGDIFGNITHLQIALFFVDLDQAIGITKTAESIRSPVRPYEIP